MDLKLKKNEYILQHHGIKGQRWGVRRYQNADGSLTEAGRKRYSQATAEDVKYINSKVSSAYKNILDNDYESKMDLYDYIGYKGDAVNSNGTTHVSVDAVETYRDAILPVLNTSLSNLTTPSNGTVSFVKSSSSMKLGIDAIITNSKTLQKSYTNAVDDTASIIATTVALMDLKEYD